MLLHFHSTLFHHTFYLKQGLAVDRSKFFKKFLFYEIKKSELRDEKGLRESYWQRFVMKMRHTNLINKVMRTTVLFKYYLIQLWKSFKSFNLFFLSFSSYHLYIYCHFVLITFSINN